MKSLLFLIPILLLSLLSCDNQNLEKENAQLKEQVTELKNKVSKMRSSDDKLLFLSSKLSGVKAKIVTNFGDIELKFFPAIAPLHCFNFITRAESGYYDGTQFHRVMSGFMIQGGDPITKTNNVALYGTGGPIVNIPHEFNNKSHKRGILSTARGDINLGAGSQFFIMHANVERLDNQYTVFGEVTNGMDVVDKIAAVETVPPNRPKKPVRIETIEVYR